MTLELLGLASLSVFWFTAGVLFQKGWEARKSNRQQREMIGEMHTRLEFYAADKPYDPDPPKGQRARLSRADFVRRTPVRRPVRRYDKEEDASDPFR